MEEGEEWEGGSVPVLLKDVEDAEADLEDLPDVVCGEALESLGDPSNSFPGLADGKCRARAVSQGPWSPTPANAPTNAREPARTSYQFGVCESLWELHLTYVGMLEASRWASYLSFPG